MRLLLTSLAAAVIVIGLASQASAAGSAPGIVAQAIDLAAPSRVRSRLVSRPRPHRLRDSLAALLQRLLLA